MKVSESVRITSLENYECSPIDFTPMLRTEEGTMTLRPIQNKALTIAKDAGGLVGLIGCGAGKTLISLLLGEVLGCEKVLLLLPASLVRKTQNESELYRKHFNFKMPAILSYEKLSYYTGIELLNTMQPELIVCDEAHKLKSMDSARTKRLGRYIAKNLATKLVVMSGTLLNKSLHDLAHLSEWALRERSPLPRNSRDVEALDLILKGEANKFQYAQFRELNSRAKFLDRMESVGGVCITNQENVKSSLRLNTWRLKMPSDLQDAIRTCFEEGVVEGLEDFDVDLDAIAESDHLWEDAEGFASRGLHQLALGCIYYWDWEGERNDDWLNARREWSRAKRTIKDFELKDFDSDFLIESNFYSLPEEVISFFEKEYLDWQVHKSFVPPPKKKEWVSDYIVDACKQYLEASDSPCIFWVNLQEVGNRLSKELGIPYFGAGTEPPKEAQNCLLSIKAHATGKNLQAWRNNLVVHPVSDPSLIEQLIARTHREGQLADEVEITFFTHSIFGSSLNRATKQAYVVQESTNQPMRLCYADRIKYHG